MTPLMIFSALEFCIIVALIFGYFHMEKKENQMREDWNEDLIDLGIAWRLYVKSIGGDWNVYVKSRRRFYEQFNAGENCRPLD
jgi:hypothetical protein